MGLPEWTDDGLLPPGCWRATLTDVHDRLVVDTQYQPTRQVVFHGLQAYLGQIREFVSSGVVWLDGPFVTRDGRPSGPALSLVVFPHNLAEIDLLTPERYHKLTTMFTMRDIIIGGTGQTTYIDRLEPIGTHIAAHLADDNDAHIWSNWCSRVDGGSSNPVGNKGFVEVEL
ncbi:hypothetical protein IU450_32965 [Nocardia abscessus]|uniref:DUF6932 family protein n=1 Tax=Nocardia abscessus TaxID=120957 RepID=UPI0018961ED0|nr:hypothetical protein [Nocardia abscessus]MBF6340671.1 hypothetical protein [Nocardia abscessus]